MLEKGFGREGCGKGLWMEAAVGPKAQARVDKDFVRQSFPCCLPDPEQWGNNISERCEKFSSSHQLGMKQ